MNCYGPVYFPKSLTRRLKPSNHQISVGTGNAKEGDQLRAEVT